MMSRVRPGRRLCGVTRAAAGVVAVLVVALTGCGSGEQPGDAGVDPSTSSTPTSVGASPTPAPSTEATATQSGVAASGPVCADVWQAGLTLPRGYKGCVDKDGSWVKADVIPCSSGQVVVVYGNRHYAVGRHAVVETVTRVQQDPTFKNLRAACTA